MSEQEPHVRTELGAYVLGALEPAERRAVERHLDSCASCRDEVSKLSILPSLLDRLDPEEASADFDEVRRGLSLLLQRSTSAERRRLRRQVTIWRVATVAASVVALLVGVVAWQPWREPPDRIVVEIVPMADRASTVGGTVAAYAWEWGTTVEIRVEELPPAPGYAVWAISEDGHRERAGTWGPTSDGAAWVRGASAIQRAQLARVEITDTEGSPLFGAVFDVSCCAAQAPEDTAVDRAQDRQRDRGTA
ncbi:MAG: zf-HC2 domain-containing protein [Actinobacteria bacterium]|nr:zf-HC2 domain-containing protein [Actinomycetota bacterium]